MSVVDSASGLEKRGLASSGGTTAAFSAEGLTFSLERTSDGKVKATVTPEGAPPSFFLRVKVR